MKGISPAEYARLKGLLGGPFIIDEEPAWEMNDLLVLQGRASWQDFDCVDSDDCDGCWTITPQGQLAIELYEKYPETRQ